MINDNLSDHRIDATSSLILIIFHGINELKYRLIQYEEAAILAR